MKQPCPEPVSPEQLPFQLNDHLSALTGRASVAGAQIARLVRLVANQYETHSACRSAEIDLSGPRLDVLMRLLWRQRCGETAGLTPTELSLDQRISRNTVSALLRGLEDQGLIERRLDPADRRVFRIVLSQAGLDLVNEHAPRSIDHLNTLVSDFSPAECSRLIELLGKLYLGLSSQQPVDSVSPEA
jgi:DNA-binding MarR family transcriptional regulator